LGGKLIGLNHKKELNESSWFGKPKWKIRSKVIHSIFFLLFFTIFFDPYCSNFTRMEDMLWIEDIVEN